MLDNTHTTILRIVGTCHSPKIFNIRYLNVNFDHDVLKAYRNYLSTSKFTQYSSRARALATNALDTTTSQLPNSYRSLTLPITSDIFLRMGGKKSCHPCIASMRNNMYKCDMPERAYQMKRASTNTNNSVSATRIATCNEQHSYRIAPKRYKSTENVGACDL